MPGRRLVERALLGFLACAARGRWRSRRSVPSARPARTAATSASVRSGGFTLNTGSNDAHSASVSVKWCGVASARDGTRRSALAARTSATDPAVERCRKWTRPPVRRAEREVAHDHRAPPPRRAARRCRAAPTTRPRACDRRRERSSSQCCARITSRSAAYSNARRMSAASATQSPSSVKRRTPSSSSSPIGASRSPPRPTVIAPATRTSHSPAALRGRAPRARLRRRRSAARCSACDHRGAAAERRRARSALDRLGLLATGLAGSGPGCRRGPARRRSRSRRARTRPSRSGPTAAMRPSSPTATSATAGCRSRRSRGRPSARAQPTVVSCAEQPEQDRHAHGDAVATCSVITERGRSATSAAISTPRFIGPGCMTNACSGRRANRLRSRPEPRAVLAQRREQRLGLALELHAQEVHDVDFGSTSSRSCADVDRPTVERSAASAWAGRRA